jgi:hypothetical protein
LSASASTNVAKPVSAAPAPPKKKKARRALKITNTHMKAQVRTYGLSVNVFRVSTFHRIMLSPLSGLSSFANQRPPGISSLGTHLRLDKMSDNAHSTD